MTQRRRKSRKPQEDIRKQQAAKDQQEVIALAGADWEKQVAERDEKIAALEVRVAEVAKNLKVAEALRGEIAELKAQGESDRIDFKLQLAGVRNVKVARCPGRPRWRRRRAQGGGAVAVRRHPCKATGRQDGASQCRHQHGRRQDHETHLNYLFYSCTNPAGVSGLGDLSGVRSMRYTFSSCVFTTIDFRGFDPSMLTDLFYTFSGCSSLATIYADSTWALPSSGITGSQCFYSCSTSLVGGNGTVWASNKTAYTYFRVDTASTPGYITAS